MTTQETAQQAQAVFPGPMEFLQYFADPKLIMGIYVNEEGKHFTRLYLALPNGDAVGGPLMTHVGYDTDEEARQEALDINDGKITTYPHAVFPKIESTSEPSIDFVKSEWSFSIRTSVEFGDLQENHTILTVDDYDLSFPDEYSAKAQFKIIAEENVKLNAVMENAKLTFVDVINELQKLKADE